ncbi:MAG: hypothetical protein P8X96_22060 [Desulfobacteraceae bacterium]
MLLNLTMEEARDFIESAEIIRKDQVIPGHFRPCPDSTYKPGLDWLYRYERAMMKSLEPVLTSLPPDLIGEKSLFHAALSNAFRHAHHGDRLKPITVSVLQGRKGFLIQVTDCGRGFNLHKIYKHCRRKRRYLTPVGSGIRRMAESRRYGVFYNPKGTAFHLLYLFEDDLEKHFSHKLTVLLEPHAEAA